MGPNIVKKQYWLQYCFFTILTQILSFQNMNSNIAFSQYQLKYCEKAILIKILLFFFSTILTQILLFTISTVSNSKTNDSIHVSKPIVIVSSFVRWALLINHLRPLKK